jgi:hypothetical protein
MLDIEIDKNFFSTNIITHSRTPADNGYWEQNLHEIYHKELKHGHISLYTYKKKYNVFFDADQNKKVFNRKFKEPIHRLTIAGHKLKEIKTLPKELLSLWLQGIPKNYKLKLSTVPKTIVTLFYRWTEYTLGDDISTLKNLKVLGLPGNHMIFNVPKFPKSIEYVDLSDCQIGRFDDNGLDNFKLSDYPNLKYINFSGNWIKKIPMGWKKCKTVKIIFGKQKK